MTNTRAVRERRRSERCGDDIERSSDPNRTSLTRWRGHNGVGPRGDRQAVGLHRPAARVRSTLASAATRIRLTFDSAWSAGGDSSGESRA